MITRLTSSVPSLRVRHLALQLLQARVPERLERRARHRVDVARRLQDPLLEAVEAPLVDERVREAAHDGQAEGRADQLAAGRRGGRHADGCPGGRAVETRPQAREGALESEEAADRERRDDGESDRLHQVLVHDEVAALGPVLGETDERGSRDVVEAEQQRAGDGRRAGEGAREEGEPDEDEAPDVQKVDDAQHRRVRRDPVEDPREEPAGLGEVPGRGPAGVRDLDEALVEKVPAEAHPEEDEQDLLRAAGGPGRLFVRHAEPPARGPLAREASRRRAPRVKRQMAHVDESLTPRNARAYDPVTLPENAEPGACRRSSSSTTTGRPATCSGCSCGRWAIRWTPRRTAPGPWRPSSAAGTTSCCSTSGCPGWTGSRCSAACVRPPTPRGSW